MLPDTGRLIQREAAEAGVKYVSLELGGQERADRHARRGPGPGRPTAPCSGMNYTATAGQSCGSTSRLLLHESIAGQVLENVVEQVRAIRVGHPLAERHADGPGHSTEPVRQVDGRDRGGRTAAGAALAGGGRPDTVGPDGWYVAPTVLAGSVRTTRRRLRRSSARCCLC